MTGYLRSERQPKQQFFPSPSRCAPAPPLLYPNGAFFPETRQSMELTTHLHVVEKLPMREGMPPLPHSPSWRGT